MSLIGVLSVARDAMLAQTAGLDVTGQNIANASTPGYVRRGARLETRALGVGQGTVAFTGIDRKLERFSFARSLLEQGRGGAASARSEALGAAEGILAPSSGALTDRLSKFFASTQALVASPADAATRAELLGRAQALGDAFQTTAGDLSRARSDLADRAVGIATEVNERLRTIADLNGQIALAQDGAPSLQDQRDNLVREVAERIGAQAVTDDRGHFTLLSSGVALVTDGSASSLGVELDQNGALAISITPRGAQKTDITSKIDSGALAGVREARDVDLPATQKQLDQLAYDLTIAINNAHAAGFGLDGVSGRSLFQAQNQVAGAAYAMQLDPNMIGRPDRLAAAESSNAVPGGNKNALALAALASKPLGSGTPNERASGLLAGLGAAKAGADAERDLRDATLAQARTLAESASGVSLDEEMVDLTRFQRSFEAATKVLKVADELLAELIRSV